MTTTIRARIGATALALGPVLFFLAEAIAALAWQSPVYSYLHNWISDLGVPTPGVFQGRTIDSPLAWAMNTGFVIGGLGILIGGLTLAAGLTGRLRVITRVLSVLTAIGYVLVGLTHTSTAAAADGTIILHFTGAFLAILGGNTLAIVLGTHWWKHPTTRRLGHAALPLGIIGLAAVIVLGFTAMSDTAPNGLIERIAVYTILLFQLSTALHLARPAHTPPTARVAG